MSDAASTGLRQLPAVHQVLSHPELAAAIAEVGEANVVAEARSVLAHLRSELRSNGVCRDRADWLDRVVAEVHVALQNQANERLDRTINATGVVLHTNLGRAPLADRAIAAVQAAARNCNVELDLATGERRRRGHQVDRLWRELTGSEASLIVNNCAAATLLTLAATAVGKEVLVSRGQLIEIGGSYRLPEVFAASGAVLKEVGTTNRTRLEDYESAIGPNTAAILRVHPSNFRIVGFAKTPDIGDLATLAHERNILAIDDVGSGALFDLQPFGLPAEPMVPASLKAGADLVLFSGDKLLGGPQCGVILGRSAIVERLAKSPLARALRVDKLTLAALQATLEIHRLGNALTEIPVLVALTTPLEILEARARAIAARFESTGSVDCDVVPSQTAVGGGSLPLAELPSWCLRLKPVSTNVGDLARRLRLGHPRVAARIERDAVLVDLRTVAEADLPDLQIALANAKQLALRGR